MISSGKPFSDISASPLKIADCEIDQLGRRLLGRELAARFDGFANHPVQTFDGICNRYKNFGANIRLGTSDQSVCNVKKLRQQEARIAEHVEKSHEPFVAAWRPQALTKDSECATASNRQGLNGLPDDASSRNATLRHEVDRTEKE